MLLAMTAFGEHRQSHGRLYRALRELRGLNYGDYAYIERYRQSGYSAAQMPGSGRLQNPFYIWLRPVGDDNAAFALRAAVALLEELVEKGLSEAEFAQIQRYLGARVALWGTDAARRLSWATEARLMGWSEPLSSLPAQVAALRREDVNAAIARHLRPADLRIVVVTDEARAFAEPLVGGKPTPITYATAPPAAGSAQVEEDLRWSSLPLGLSGYDVKPAQDILR
jgi:zinc protease